MDPKTIWTILHLFGVAIGAGGAFAADYIFFQCAKDHKVDQKEMSFIKNSSLMVWIGLLILIISGIGLFYLNPERYLESSKFITKMIIVVVIAINGWIFHKAHTPNLAKCVNSDLRSNPFFQKKKPLFLLSGAISVTSWLGALILGSLRSIDYTVPQALGIYIICIAIAFIGSMVVTKKYF